MSRESAAPEPGPRHTVTRTVRRRVWLAFALLNVTIVVLVLAVAEAALVIGLEHPPASGFVRRALEGYYADFDRRIIQFLPECAMYDEALGYRLRPGRCRFANREFDTQIDVNAAGVRDAEADLVMPTTIVLGDSFTMGWGVSDAEAYASLLQARCGGRVLNAGISSYGTARESALLGRLDRRALRWLVVQYSDNDSRENEEFVERGYQLVPMPPSDYAKYVRLMADRATYYPGKHLAQFLPHAWSRLTRRYQPSTGAPASPGEAGLSGPDREAERFLDVLAKAPVPDDTRMLIFELNGSSRNDGVFTAAVSRRLAAGGYPTPLQTAVVLDVSPRLTPDQFLTLDEHISARGHATIAAMLGDAMQCPR